MTLEKRLSTELIRRHPERAALALEIAGAEEALRLLSHASARHAAQVLLRMTPQLAATILVALPDEKRTDAIEALPLDVAARVVRRIPEDHIAAALDGMSPRRARALRSLLRFPEGTAGALMDPDVLALPETLTALEAIDRVRETPESARYNLYVVNSEQRLVGAVNLRELLLAGGSTRLADLMVREPKRLEASADRAAIISHPGWREVHSLPVVDEKGGYLGAIRYRTLRALEDELLGRDKADADTREALGQLFSAGAGALIAALSAPISGTDEP